MLPRIIFYHSLHKMLKLQVHQKFIESNKLHEFYHNYTFFEKSSKFLKNVTSQKKNYSYFDHIGNSKCFKNIRFIDVLRSVKLFINLFFVRCDRN